MRPTQRPVNARHSHDGINFNALRNAGNRGKETFRKRTGTWLVAFLAAGVLATAFTIENGRAAHLSLHLSKVTKAFLRRTTPTAPEALTSSSPDVNPLSPTAVLLSWSTFGNVGTETTEPSTANDPNVSSANLTLGGVSPAANGNRFGGTNWFDTGNSNPTTLTESIVDNDYIQFIVTPNLGSSFTPTSLVFGWDHSATGPSELTLRSSADNFSTNLGSVAGLAASQTNGNTITISGLTQLTTATTFRLYGYGATATSGTGGFDVATNATNVVLNGTTGAIAPEINVKGNNVSIADGDATPSAADDTDFGSTSVNASTVSHTFTVENPGTAALNLTGTPKVQISGTNAADFTVNPEPTTPVGVSGSTTFTVQFDPSAGGTRTATLSIANDDNDENPYDFAIQGTGTVPDVTFNVDGNLPPGTYHDVTINGGCPTFTSVHLTGDVIITGTLTVNECANLYTDSFIVAGPGAFVLNPDGWLHITSPVGISSGTTLSGNIQVTGGRTYGTTANYDYDGSASQVVGNGLPSTVHYLLIANSGGAGDNIVTGNSGQVVTADLNVITGVYLSASDYNNVQIDAAGTVSLSAAITVSGNWINNGTFISNGNGVTFDGNTPQSISGSSATPFAQLTISNSGNVVTLNQNASDSSLAVTGGEFRQAGASNLSSGAVTVSSGGLWSNPGVGDLTLSSGVTNSGTITFNANGTPCGDSDDILITSSVNGTQRAWTGNGTFNMTDVSVQDQGGTAPLTVRSGTNNGNNGANWLFIANCTGNTYTWNGTTLADWNVGTNWTPTRVVPDPGDVMVFDGNITPSPMVSNVPTQTIAALRIINSAAVTLTTNGANRLTINGATGFDLTVTAVSQLSLAGVTNALTIDVGSGSTATIGGLLLFQDGPHRLIGNAPAAITFQSGSICTTASSYDPAVNPFGSGSGAGNGTAGSVIFQDDSNYFHNNGQSPFGAIGSSAVAVFQTGSTATWLTSNGFQGRTYSNLVIGNSSTPTVITSSGADPFEFDSLTVNSTPAANSSLTYSTGANVSVKGDITSDGNGNGVAVSDVNLLSSTAIVIARTVAGTINFNNTGGSNRTVNFGNATPGSGNATVNVSNTLALARKLIVDTGSVITVNGALSGSVSGYVIGKERRPYIGAELFVYQVGTASGYSPLDANVTAGTGNLTTEAKQPNQPLLSPATSLQRYWTLTEGGAITADLTFHYNLADVSGNESNYRLVIAEGGTATWFPENCPDLACVDEGAHTIRRTGVTNFSDWTAAEPVAPTASNGTISGQVVDSNGKGIEGVAVRMSGTQNRLRVTDREGNYHFDSVETGGFYMVTPSRANYLFSPAQRSFSQLGQQTDAVFTAANTGSALNPLDTTEYFVRQQYVDFLGREPDEAGFNFWVNNIGACGQNDDCLAARRIDTSAAFFLSIEFQQTGYLVYRMYRSAYGNMPGTPVPLVLGEFRSDTQAMGQGVVVNQSGWDTKLEANKQAFASEFVQRLRFTTIYPMTMTPTEFVDRLFLNSGVSPGDSDRAAAINEFGGLPNTADAAARAGAVIRVAENAMVRQREFNQAFVLMQYFGYLGRDPNIAPDTDFSGYNFWLNKLDSFNGDFRNAEMVKAFLVAGEYRRRFPK